MVGAQRPFEPAIEQGQIGTTQDALTGLTIHVEGASSEDPKHALGQSLDPSFGPPLGQSLDSSLLPPLPASLRPESLSLRPHECLHSLFSQHAT
ncbi:hypothetical protein BO221_01025 [Archangium sp. Cb G35]|nr:hypothetical protein BO221_01025 [Archangium sp. Cb G35]